MYLSFSEQKQLDLLKEKSPSIRFLLMIQLIQGEIELMKAGIKYKNNYINDKELELCLHEKLRKMYFLKH
jgi:hypothetical protein